MYYKRVNRGLSFTKPGLYTFGLILFVGMTAVATSINGLFVFLSIGLGGFIISGLLSERAMRNSKVTSIAAALTDAKLPFEVTFSVANRSSWFTIYSMRAMFMTEPPKFRLIAREIPTIATVRITRMPTLEEHTYIAHATGMERGNYRSILAMQLTTFPFGILEKFKINEVPASLIIAPAIDHEFLELVRGELQRQFRADEADREFHAHRPYLARDSMRIIDWKKSANKPTRDWVVKLYRSPAGALPIRVEVPWSYAVALRSEQAYESYLSAVRTVIKALDDEQRAYVLDLGSGAVCAGHDVVLAALADLPAYAQRHVGPKTTSLVVDTRGQTLRVFSSGIEWGNGSAKAAQGGGA